VRRMPYKLFVQILCKIREKIIQVFHMLRIVYIKGDRIEINNISFYKGG